MSLDLTVQEVNDIQAEAEQHCPPVTSADQIETIHTVPSLLGSGYSRTMELSPGIELSIFNETYKDLTIRESENRHLVQFIVHLSGVVDSGSFLYQDATQSYVGGSGIQKAFTSFHPATQVQIGVNIHVQPHLLNQFFATSTGELLPELQPLVQENDWQRVFSPKTTRATRSVVQQIIDCPFLGVTKRLYLQGKVFELMALQLDGILSDNMPPSKALKPDMITRIHHAAEILRSHLENPPSLADLAQQIGIGHCTLNKGFQAVFGVTPFAYLTRQRMERAEGLLRQLDWTVAEVANRVGYTNPAQFAAAFKRHFGITPRECMRDVMNR